MLFRSLLLRWSAQFVPARRRSTNALIGLTLLFMLKFYVHEVQLGQVNVVFTLLAVAGIGALQSELPVVAGILLARERIARRLPPLEVLDDVMYKAIAVGFAFFTIATILGALWAAEASCHYAQASWLLGRSPSSLVNGHDHRQRNRRAVYRNGHWL